MKNTRKKHLYKKTLKSKNKKTLKSKNRKTLKSKNKKSLKIRGGDGGGFLSWLIGSKKEKNPPQSPYHDYEVPGEIPVEKEETKLTDKEKEFMETESKKAKERYDAIRNLQTTDPTKLTIAILKAIGLNIVSGSEFNNAINNLKYRIKKENDKNLKQKMETVLTLANKANTLYEETKKIINKDMSDKQQKLTINTGERDNVKEHANNLLNELLPSS